MMTGRTQSRSAVAQVSKTKYAWVALAALIVALILGPFAGIRGSVVLAQESDREEPFPEVAGPKVASVALASESGREEPFPEVAGSIIVSAPLRSGLGVRYTDASAFYVERLRARIATPYTAVSAFYAERLRSQSARDAALATDSLLGSVGLEIDSFSLAAMGVDYGDIDPLLGAVLIEFRHADSLASGGTCAAC